jgi:uncharacterized membrane protein
VMIFWGALITLLVVLAMIPWFIGLVIVGPWVGHATWHAYRGAVAPEAATATPRPNAAPAPPARHDAPGLEHPGV